MLYNDLNIINSDCIDYFHQMKNGEYLTIIDQEGNVKASFFKKEEKFYEYFNIFTATPLDDYKEFASPLSFLFRNEPSVKTYTYHICNQAQWSKQIKISNFKNVLKELTESGNNNAKFISKKIDIDGGKLVSFGSSLNFKGLLVCAVATDEDYYWVYIDTNLGVNLSSCVGGYEFIDGNGVEFNILRNLMESDPESLYQRVLERFENTSDAIFTSIVISKTFSRI